MNDQTVAIRPEVQEFVDRVRALMADLDADERLDLTGGLEADLSELVAEHGVEALGEPDDYARELRVAAGHPPVMGRPARDWQLRAAVQESLDAAHDSWDRLLDSLPSGGPRPFLAALQPVWWVVRAWAAWMVALDIRGAAYPRSLEWFVVLAVFVLVSVQLGRGGWSLGRVLERSVVARLLLVALNVVAVLALPGAADRAANGIAEERAWIYAPSYAESEPVDSHVVTYRGGQACVLQVFDADGERVRGGYVWDATGERRLPMNTRNC